MEWEFKRGKGGAPLGFERDGRTFAVQGKIDRIDLSEEGPPLLCVYDFKSAARFTLDAIYHGLSLQLPLYLEALRLNARQVAGREAAVCGALFHATRAGLQAADGPVEEPDAEAIPPRFKPRGLLSLTGLRRFEPKLSGGSAYFRGSIKKDGALGARRSSDILEDRELDRLLERVGAVTGELLAAMAGGRAAAVPALHRRATACSRCRFGAVCRFERFGPGERYARHATLGVEEVLAALGAAPAREGGRG